MNRYTGGWNRRAAGFRINFSTINRVQLVILILALATLHAFSQNTPDNINNGQTDLTAAATYSTGTPTTSNDVVLTSQTYSPVAFTLNTNGFNLNIGTLDDLDATQTITIDNKNGSGTSTITLTNTSGNSVSGTSTDLIYVATGGILSIGTASTGTLDLALGATGTLDIAGTANIGAVITGTHGLTMNGAGNLVLTNNGNTFSGGTTISAGTITVDNNVNGELGTGALTLNGGTLLTTSNTAVTLAASHIITVGASGGTISVQGSGSPGSQKDRIILNTANQLVGSGALTILGTGNLDSNNGSGVLVINSSNTYSGIVTLQNGGMIEYANATSLGAGATITLGTNGGFANDSLAVSNAINVTGSGATLFFSNGGGGTFSGPITLGSNTLLVDLHNWYNGTAESGTISGAISGTGGVTVVAGSGASLTLSGANTYSGATTVQAGTTLNVTGSLGTAGTYSGAIVSAGTLNFNESAAQALTGTVSLSGILANNGSSAVTMSGPVTLTGVWTDNGTGSLTSNGGISGAFAVTDTGTGTLTLGGTNSYSGATTVAAGTFNLTGSLTSTSGITVSGASTTFTEAGTGAIGGSASLTLSGGSTVTLAGANTFTGATNLSGGSSLTLDFSQAGSPASNIMAATSAVTLGGSTLSLNGNLGGTNSQTLAGLTIVAGTSDEVSVNQNGAAAVNLNLGTITRGAQSTLDISFPTTGTVTTSTLSASNGILVDGNGTAYATANLATSWLANSSGTLSAYSAYSTGNANYLATNNVDVGTGDSVNMVTVNTLRFNSNDSLTLAGTNIVSTGGILITPFGSGTISGGTLESAGGKELVLLDNGTLNVSSTIADSASGASNLSLLGAGTTTLSGANTFTGSVTVSGGGLLAVTNTSAFQSANSIAVGNGSTLDFQVNKETVGGFNDVNGSGGSVTTSTGSAVITIAGGASDSFGTIGSGGNNGLITGSTLSIVMNGTGTQTLDNGSSTYGGGTRINSGTISINASGSGSFIGVNGSILGTSTVATSGPLGIGTITLAGGTLSEPNSGNYTLYNNVLLAAGTSSTINGGSSSLTIDGGLSGDGTLNYTNGSGSPASDLLGNNSAYSGSITYGGGRSRILSSVSGSANAVWSLNGATDSPSWQLSNPGTIYFGELTGGANDREDGSLATLNIGALNISSTYTGAVASSGGAVNLTKVGTGSLTLTLAQGINAASTVTVQGGTLALNDTTAGNAVFSNAVTLNLAGGTLSDTGSSTTAETFSGTTISLGGSGITTPAGDSHVTNLGAITRSAGGVVNFTPLSTTFAAAGSITTTTANNAAGILGGYATINGSDWATATGSTPFTIGVYSGYTALTAAGGGTPTTTNFSFTGTGSGTTTLTGAITANSLKITDTGSTGDTLANGGNAITFSGTAGGLLMTGGGTYTINGAGIVGAGAANEFITNVNTGSTLTIGSQIIGNNTAGSLTKAGNGTLILTGNNNYTGLTTIDGGILRLGSANAIGTGSISFGGGTLQYSGSNNTDYSSSIVNSNGAISIDTNGQAITFASPLASTYTATTNSYTGNIGGLTVSDSAGGGSLTLSAANTYIGTTTLNSGTLDITGSGTLGAETNVNYNQLTVNGGTLNLGGTTQTTGVTNFNGGTIQNGTLAGLAYASSNTSGTATVSASLTGNLGVGLTKTGAGGTLLLTGTNTYLGQTTISGGILQLGNANAVENSTVSIGVANGLTYSPSIGTFNLGGLSGGSNESLNDTSTAAVTLSVGSNNSSTTYSGVLSGLGGLVKVGTGTLSLTSGTASTFTGGTTLNAGTLLISNNIDLGGAGGTAGAVTINGGTLATTAAQTDTHPITIGASGGTIQVDTTNTGSGGTGQYRFSTATTLMGSGTLTVTGAGLLSDFNTGSGASTGAGNLYLGAAQSTFTGNVILQNGGSLEDNATTALPATDAIQIGNQGELIVDSTFAVSNNVTVLGGTNSVLSFNGLGGTYAGTLTMNADTTIGLRNWWNGTTATGTISGQVTGTGLLTVNSNSLTGNLILTNANNNYAGNTTINSSTLTIGGSGVLGGGNYAGTITDNGAFVYNSTAAQTLSGPISGTGTLTQSGTGTLTLSGAAGYTGVSTVNSGTLSVTGATALSGTSQAVVNTGGTLLFGSGSSPASGTGAPPVQLNGGTLAVTPVSGSATTYSMGALSLTASTSYIDFGSGAAGETVSINFTLATGLSSSQTLSIYDYDNNGAQDHLLFTSLPSNLSDINFYSGTTAGTFLESGVQFGASEVVPGAVPEPSTWIAGAGLLGMLLWRRRQNSVAAFFPNFN